jgi:hypothetical protein
VPGEVRRRDLSKELGSTEDENVNFMMKSVGSAEKS